MCRASPPDINIALRVNRRRVFVCESVQPRRKTLHWAMAKGALVPAVLLHAVVAALAQPVAARGDDADGRLLAADGALAQRHRALH